MIGRIGLFFYYEQKAIEFSHIIGFDGIVFQSLVLSKNVSQSPGQIDILVCKNYMFPCHDF